MMCLENKLLIACLIVKHHKFSKMHICVKQSDTTDTLMQHEVNNLGIIRKFLVELKNPVILHLVNSLDIAL